MSHFHPRRLTRPVSLLVATLALVLAVPIAVFAAHSFQDVPDSNQFHGSISWMKDNGVTVGCNPPANTEFCPKDNVTREQMAAFMRRLAQTSGNAGESVTDPGDTIATNGTAPVELLTLDIAPKSDASVKIDGHVTLSKPTDTEGSYQVVIAEESCTGTVVAAAGWAGPTNTEGTTEAVTVSLSGVVTADGATTYVLCASETVDASPVANAGLRGLTASWSPTA